MNQFVLLFFLLNIISNINTTKIKLISSEQLRNISTSRKQKVKNDQVIISGCSQEKRRVCKYFIVVLLII